MPADGCNLNHIALGTVNAVALVSGAPIVRNMSKISSISDEVTGIQALISSRCAEEAREIGRLAYFWKLPVINRMGFGSSDLFHSNSRSCKFV